MNRRYLLQASAIIFFLCCVLSVRAQKTEIDSLRLVLLHNNREDTSQVILLNDLAYLSLSRNLEDQSEYCKKAFNLSRHLGYKRGLAESYRMLGLAELYDQGDSKALLDFQKSLSLFSELRDLRGQANVLLNISWFNFLQGKIKYSQKLMDSSLVLSRKSNYKYGEARGLHNYGELELSQKHFERARICFDSALHMAKKMGMTRFVISGLESLGDLNKAEGKLNAASNFYQQAMNISYKTGNYQQQIDLFSEMGSDFEARKKYKEAQSAYTKCISLSRKYGSSSLLAQAYLHMAILDSTLNDFKGALGHYGVYVKIKDSIDKTQKERQTIQMQNRFETERKEKENRLLLVQDVKNRNVIKQQYIGLFLLIVMVVILILNSQKLRNLNAMKAQSLVELQLMNDEIHNKTDIIEQQKIEQEKINLVKDKLFSVISHDMRAPLTQLKGILNLMEMKALDSDEWEELVPELKKNVNHSTEQLDNLLMWSKNQMHGFHPNLIPFTIFNLVEKSRYMLETASQRKQIQVLNKIDPDLKVVGDKEMMQIVVRNLMSNAIKFTPAGGHVEVYNTIKDLTCTISVSDTGVGVKKENMDRIFDELDYTTKGTAQEKGTGLGLKLAKDFVIMNHGTIWVESPITGGSHFMFTLPLAT